MQDFCVYIDAGHGGLDSSGKYTTTASGKEYTHGNVTFYEGVFNRKLCNKLAEIFRVIGIDYQFVSHPWLDWPLRERTRRANWYHKTYKPGILISNHANASPEHNARGFEVFTSPGTTLSDRLADLYFDYVRALFGDRIRYRSDKTDGDHDKEARFWMLTQTAMPAILSENLFFDHPEDAKLLQHPDTVLDFATAQALAVCDFYDVSPFGIK